MSASNRRVTYIGVANDSFGAQVGGFRFPPGEWVVSDGTGRDYEPTFRAKRVSYKDICATLHTHLSECAELPSLEVFIFLELLKIVQVLAPIKPINLSVSVQMSCFLLFKVTT